MEDSPHIIVLAFRRKYDYNVVHAKRHVTNMAPLTLAVAAATAVGTAGPDGHVWADVAATRLSARKQEPSTESPPGHDPSLRRPPPLFPPEDRPRH